MNYVETTNNAIGGDDTIDIYGGDNTVMGGAADDTITIGVAGKPESGANNVVLGDGGKYVENDAVKTVETIDDAIGGNDAIQIYGGSNIAMGGAADDIINIGESASVTSDNNVVLGDGGKYDLQKGISAEIKTTSDDIGGNDTINIYGGKNVVMGGAEGDYINIGKEGSAESDDNVVLGDGGIASYDKSESAVGNSDSINAGLYKVETTSDGIGGGDTIKVNGGINIVMGGYDDDVVNIEGADNVVVGDGGVYEIHEQCLTVETKSEPLGGHDIITTGNGKNTILGGTDVDEITTGNGNDIIVGDGGLVIMDKQHNPLIVTNSGKNVAEELAAEQDETNKRSAGGDIIVTSGGDNVIFGGLGNDDITSGNGEDVVFGDNGYATFRGNAGLANNLHETFTDIQGMFEFENTPVVRDSATLSFNFQGTAQQGLNANDTAGASNFAAKQWNNIAGSLAGTYGNDDKEIVRFDDGTRASSVSVSYAGHEYHRNTSTDVRINTQNYNHGLWGNSANNKLMTSGIMTTAPNNQMDSVLEVAVDGLQQHFDSYQIVVYLDIPDSHSSAEQSIREVVLTIGDYTESFFVNDYAGANFNGQFVQSSYRSAQEIINIINSNRNKPSNQRINTYGNYVVFNVSSEHALDRAVITIRDGYTLDQMNGKDLPGIAGLQIKGSFHKQDIAASTDIKFGGDDVVKTSGGDDVVVGGTGSDNITTYGDERQSINDNDIVFGDNAKMLFTDRDSNDDTATTLSTAESIGITADTLSHSERDNGVERLDVDKYKDTIKTGDGNDVVVGGIGADRIESGATTSADTKLDGVNVWSLNFTSENANSTNSIAAGEAAGVVVDTNWTNMYLKNGSLHKVGGGSSSNDIKVNISAYRQNDWNWQNAGNYSMTHENYDEIDGDTANSKLYNFYLAAQQQEEIRLKLTDINKKFDTASGYDIYVYLGGDNNDTDTYNYLYQIKLTDANGRVQYRYLNDWTGYTFDGDYKEAYCSSYQDALEALTDYATPRVEIIGNYVVFRNVTGNLADIRIKNVYSFGGQSPKNLPVISAVQIVSGAAKDTAAIGGDHDKDLVYGDDAKLTFDLDIPFATDENIADYRNRVIEAKSVAIDNSVVKKVSTDDTIITGKDRDVVVGGEGADNIKTGLGDDIALGGSANLIVEHNNPVGVFTPNTEIVLDQHTIDLNIHRNYLDNDNANVQQMQNQLNQNRIVGIDTSVSNTNDRKDTIDAGAGRNLTFQASSSTSKLVETPTPVSQGSGEGQGQSQGSGEGQGQSQGSGEGQGQSQGSGEGQGQSQGSGEGQGSTEMRVEQINRTPQVISLVAGETIKLVCTEYPQGNQWWTPNVVIYGNNAGNSSIPEIDWAWDGSNKAHTNVGYNVRVDIPDHPNGANGTYEIYLTAKTSGMMILYIDQG